MKILLLTLLLAHALLAPCLYAEDIRGATTVDNLSESLAEYGGKMLGLPNNLTEFVTDSITPKEVSELNAYLDKLKDYVQTAEQVSQGNFEPVAMKTLKKSYNALKGSKKVSANLRMQLPGLDQIDKLMLTYEFAMKMKEAAKANAVAVQADSFFHRLAYDSELGGPDDPLPTGMDTAERVYDKYWKGGTKVQMEDVMRHQRYLSYPDPGDSAPDEEKSTYRSNVLDGIMKLLKMAAEFKEVTRAQWLAQRELQELTAAYGRWGALTKDDFDQLISLLGIEKQTETMLPELEKLPAEASAGLSAARAALKPDADRGKANSFCSDMQSRLYNARLRLRDFGQKSQKIAQRTRPLYLQLGPLQKEVDLFCNTLYAADRKKAEEEQLKEQKDHERYLAEATKACAYGAITGAAYSGPKQADVNALAAEIDSVLGSRDGGGSYIPTFDFGALDRDPGAYGNPDYAFIAKEGDSQKPDYAKLEREHLAGDAPVYRIFREALEMHRQYYEASEAFNKTTSKALQAAQDQSTLQQAKCEAQATAAAKNENSQAPACGWCDSNPAHAAYLRKMSEVPSLNFEVLNGRVHKWKRLAEQVNEIAQRADAGVTESFQRIKPPGNYSYSCNVPIVLEEQDDYSEFRSNQSLHTAFTSLKQMRDFQLARHANLTAEYSRQKRDALRQTAAVKAEMQVMKKRLQDLSDRMPQIVSQLRAAADFLDKTPWSGGESLRTKAAEYQEWLRGIEQELQQWDKGEAEELKSFAGCPALHAAIEAKAYSDGAAANKLESIYNTINEDWLLRAIEMMADGTNPKTKYVTGADSARLIPLQAKLREMAGQVQGVVKRAAPFLEGKLKGMIAVAAGLTPVPANAILLDNGNTQTLLEASSYQELERKARAAATRGAGFQVESELIQLQAQVEALHHFEELEITDYANHPVYKSYLAALAACETGLAKTEKAQAGEQDRIRKEHAAIMRDLDTVIKNPKLIQGGMDALRKRADKLVKDIYALSGKDRDELGVDAMEVQEKMRVTETQLEEKAAAAADAKALAQVAALHKRAMALPRTPAAVPELDKIMAEAVKIAQAAGIDGHLETREIMEALAEKRNAFPSVAPTGALAPKPTAQDEEDQRVMENALEDLLAEERALGALPGGAASEAAINEIVDKARNTAENAMDSFPKGPGGIPHPNRKLVEEAFARLQKTANLRKAGVRVASGPGAGPGPGGPPPPGADAAGIEAVRALYQKFAQAYSSKDLAGVLDLLTEDWESTEGITLSDMERTLENSFSVFDSIKMEIQNLQIRSGPDGTFQANYNTLLTGNIRQNDIKHEEKSFQRDTVVMTPQGAKILKTAGNTAWVR